MIEELIQKLRRAKIHLDDRELADILWLSRFLPSIAIESEIESKDSITESLYSSDFVAPAENKTSKSAKSNLVADTVYPSITSSVQPSAKHPIYIPSALVGHDSEGKRASAIRVPGAAALPNELEISRALRPLARRWKSGRDLVLDEEETVQRSAETRFRYPVFKPALERWFDIALVVEETPSMVVWQQLTRELALLLERHGAFRDIRVWRLQVSGGKVLVRDTSGVARAPESLNDPSSRRLIILLSDCSSQNWRDVAFANVIRDWASLMPVIVGHMLSEKLWRNTALGLPNTRVKSSLPGQPNSMLTFELPLEAEKEELYRNYIPLPVLALNPALIGQWATMLMNPGAVYNKAALLTLSVNPTAFTKDLPTEENLTPEQRVQRFQALVSDEAYDLAIYLSILPLPSLTLPVMRLVQSAMLAHPQQGQIAEVLLGGVIRRKISVGEEGLDDKEDKAEYVFHDGVNHILERKVSGDELHRVYQYVPKLIEQHIGTPFDFIAFLENPEGEEITTQAASFVSLARDVLRRLGISHAPPSRIQPLEPEKIRESFESDLREQPLTNKSIGVATRREGQGRGPQNVPPDLIPRVQKILLPLVATVDDREALLTEAFYLHDPLLYRFERRGSPKVFVVKCVKQLLDYGCLSNGEHALSRLLQIARSSLGLDKLAEIDELIQIANALCQATPSPLQAAEFTPSTDPAPLQTIATPREERRPTVFLSYSHADAEFANRLIGDLRAAGHACWIDTTALKGGDEWIQTIAEGILNSYALIVIVTRRALESRWVQDEILWARQKNKLIIPLILEDVLNEPRFFPLTSYQGVKLFDSDYAIKLPELLRSLPTPLSQLAPLQTIATPRAERRQTVFINYSHTDAEFANRLIGDLRAAGHACWIDTTALKGGDEWIQTIAEGILNSYVMVVVVTKQALESRWVRDEILWARENSKMIIPLLLEDVMNDKRFLPLATYQGVTLFDSDYTTALSKLLSVLPGVSRKVELAYLERLKLEELLNSDRYISMGGVSQQKRHAEMRAVFELLPMVEGKPGQQFSRRFENAVEEIQRVRRAVLLGEPGGGKTTTLWKLAADLTTNALIDRTAPIPLLIRLARWTEHEQPLHAFISSQLGELGDYVDLLLNEKRAALLFDGLEELPASQRAAKYPQLQRFLEQYPQLLAVVSCRELDYAIDLGIHRINLMPLDPLRIREFVERYLGAERGELLFWHLAGGAEVRAVWEVWKKAGASFELFWASPEVPKVNPRIYGITTGEQDRVWQEKVRGQHTLIQLACNPYMLLMLASVYAEQGQLPENRGELFQLFVQTLLKRERIPENEKMPLIEGLARIAYEMQIRRAQDDSSVLTGLPRERVKGILNERLLYLAGSAGIINIDAQVCFKHQLLQEYFAARFMESEIRSGQLRAIDIWPSDRWWERTNWEEGAILLAGLYSDNCAPVVEWLAEANPEVAAHCVVRSGAALDDDVRERLRTQWTPRLTDLMREPKPEARAAIGRALGLTGWDNRKGVGIVRHAHSVALPDIEWIEIPAGEFQYGDKDENDSPSQKLTLPTFHISRYPVTCAQFQTFLDDPEGYAKPQWFEGLAANEESLMMQGQMFNFTNHPREKVNWYQSLAFCRWLSWRLGGAYNLKKISDWPVRLPTEYEWEKAARGVDGRMFPYGNDADVAKSNTYNTGIGQSCAVGIFPNGTSPYGVMDLSGNVWEWCLSNYDKPSLNAQQENLGTGDRRVLRGGSWEFDQGLARTVIRNYEQPSAQDFGTGFRIVMLHSRPEQPIHSNQIV